MKIRVLLGAVVIGAMSFLWVWNCTGPDPALRDVQLFEPEQDGDPYRMQAVIENKSRGPGSVTVTFMLLDEETKRVYQEEKQLELERNGEAVAVAEIPAPPGKYTPRVELEYPSR